MKRKFLFLIGMIAVLGACGYSGNGSQDNPVVAKAMIIESNDGSRYHCQGIESNTYGAYTILSVFDCEKIEP